MYFVNQYCFWCVFKVSKYSTLHVTPGITFGIIGKICEHNRQTFMGIAQKNSAQVCKHNGLTPS